MFQVAQRSFGALIKKRKKLGYKIYINFQVSEKLWEYMLKYESKTNL